MTTLRWIQRIGCVACVAAVLAGDIATSAPPKSGKLGPTVTNTDLSGGKAKIGGSMTLPSPPPGLTAAATDEMVDYAGGFLKFIENQVPQGLKMYDGTEPEVDVGQIGEGLAATLRSAENKARKDLGDKYSGSALPRWFDQNSTTLNTLRTSARSRVFAARQARTYIGAFQKYNKKVEAKKKKFRETGKELVKAYQEMEKAIAAGGKRMADQRAKFRSTMFQAKSFQLALVKFKKDVDAIAKNDDPTGILADYFLASGTVIAVTEHMKSEKAIMAALTKWGELKGALLTRANELYKDFMERTKSTREEKWFFRDLGKPLNGCKFNNISDAFKDLYIKAGG